MTAETGAVQSAQGEDRSIYQRILPWFEDDFGFAKATEATDWRDPTFPANWAELRRAGKPRGAYHFFHPELSAVAQATFFVSVVRENGLEPGDMLVVDSEIAPGPGGVLASSNSTGMGTPNIPFATTVGAPELVGLGTLRFLRAVAQLVGPDHPLLVYTNLNVAQYLGCCTRFDLWIANPALSAPESVAPWKQWRFWQWEFGGGEGGGDRDAYNGTKEEMMVWINSFKPEPSPQPPDPVPPTPPPTPIPPPVGPSPIIPPIGPAPVPTQTPAPGPAPTSAGPTPIPPPDGPIPIPPSAAPTPEPAQTPEPGP
jgi:GH25 family lysozyme M1 (1,4-beta-N-acetylmuramidase)